MTAQDLRGLRQPDQRSCGPSSLVAARLLLDPARDRTAFAAEVLALHRELTAPVMFGRAQLPWPRALGTPPWAVARALSQWTGRRYRTRVVRFGGRGAAHDAVRAAAGLPCPLYVGSAWLPRHVVLAVAGDAGVEVYDPARGTVEPQPREPYAAGRVTATGRWRVPWFTVLPA